MNTLILLLFLLSQTIGERLVDLNCSDAHSEAQDAYVYSKKAYKFRNSRRSDIICEKSDDSI